MGAASSSPDQAQEQARSGGRVRRTTGDGTLRLIEKASSCGQEKGHRGVRIGEAGPTVAPGGEAGTGEPKKLSL